MAQAAAQAIQVLADAAGHSGPAAQAQADPQVLGALQVLAPIAAGGDAAALAAIAPSVPAAQAQPQSQAALQVLAAVDAGVALHAANAAGGDAAAIAAIAPAAVVGVQSAVAALAPVVVAANVNAAIALNQAAINAVVPAVSALAAGAGANQAGPAAAQAIVPANAAAAAAAVPRLGLLAALASGSSGAALAIGNAVSTNLRNVAGIMMPAQGAAPVPALALLPQGQGAVAANVQQLPQGGAGVAQPPLPAAQPVRAPGRVNNYIMRGNPIRGPDIQNRQHIVGQLAQNLIIDSAIIAQAIQGEVEFLAAYNIRPGHPGYDVILSELVLLRIQSVLGGVHLTLNASHFLDRADLPAQISANDYRRRLTILESQAQALIASAGVYADQRRLDMIIKYRRESLTEQLIATELNAMYERIKYGQHGQLITDYGPFMDGIHAAILTMNAAADAGVADQAGTTFLTQTYPGLLALMPVTIHNQVIKIKLRQIEAAACLYAYYLSTDPAGPGPHDANRANINLDYLTSNIRVFMTSEGRVAQLGLSRFRVDLAPALGLNPYRYLFDRTVMDLGRFMFRFGNNTRLAALTLLSQLVHSHPTSQALNPAFIHQMMVAIEEQLGASNSDPGSLVFADPFIRDGQGQIVGAHLGGAGVGANVDIRMTEENLYFCINTIVDNMVNNGTIDADKTTLKEYFRELIILCSAGCPDVIPALDGARIIINPYYKIEMQFRAAVFSYTASSAVLEAKTAAFAASRSEKTNPKKAAAALAKAKQLAVVATEMSERANEAKKLFENATAAGLSFQDEAKEALKLEKTRMNNAGGRHDAGYRNNLERNLKALRRGGKSVNIGKFKRNNYGNKTKKIKKTHRKKARNRKQSRRQ